MTFEQLHISSLFENATEGFIITNSSGTMVLVNPSACRMFGYAHYEMEGQKIELLIPDQFRKEHEGLRNEFYHEPMNRVMGHGRDLYARYKTGDMFPVEVSLSTYLQDGERYVIAFVVDITHRKAIERNMMIQQQQLEDLTHDMRNLNTELEAKVEERTIILKEALQKLEQSQQELSEALDKERQLNEIKSRFVSMASHEFRTPLSTVLSSASLLGKYVNTGDQDKRLKHIEKIKGSVKHLNDLLEDFLSLGKLDEGKVAATPGPFNLQDVVEETIEEMRAIAKSGQQLLYNHTGPSEWVSDKRLLKNILINLIANALKFSAEKSTVHVTSAIANNNVTIEVSDEGIGISAEDQQHLFSSFYRGKNALNIPGTGLGLHIVKRYTELLGGSIAIHSILGKGTTITLTLPDQNNAYGNDHSDN